MDKAGEHFQNDDDMYLHVVCLLDRGEITKCI